MTGLRERKKRQTRLRILAVAAQRIIDQGFDATTIDDVAAEAEVGVGTVYNYFGSKTGLLLAIFRDEAEAMISAGDAVTHAHMGDPLDAVLAVLLTWFDKLAAIDGRLLTEAMRVGFSRQGDEAAAFMELDYQMIGHLAELLAELQGRGLVERDHGPDEQALALYGTAMVQLLMVVMAPGTEIAAARASLIRQAEIVVNGLRPAAESAPQRSTGPDPHTSADTGANPHAPE